jgi:hypothetical protein
MRALNTRTVVRLPERQLSESILHLAEPLLRPLGSAPEPDEVRRALEVAINIWNSHVRASPFWGSPDPEPLAALREAMCGKDAPPGLSDTFELLSAVRLAGDWESWVLFFAEGIRQMADGAVTTARKLEEISVEDRVRISALGRVSGSALRIHHILQRRPLVSIAHLVAETRMSAPTAASALAALGRAGVVREITGRKRNRLFAYERYLAILREGTDRE